MSHLIQESVDFNIRGMRICGLYFSNKYKNLSILRAYVMYFLFVVPLPILECLKIVLQEEELTLMRIADNAFLLAEAVEAACFIPKFWPFITNNERIRKCINHFQSQDVKNIIPEHQQILQDCVTVCRRVTILYFTSLAAGVISWSSKPISWKNHMFPTDVWLPFDPNTAPKIYVALVYIYLVLSVVYSGFASGVVDPLIGGLAYQATAQVKILKYNLLHLDEYVAQKLASTTHSLDVSEKSKILYQRIKECVIHHNDILKFATEYEECFSQVAFSQFFGGVVVFCVACLQLTMVDVFSFNFLTMIMYLVIMLTEVYIYCHFGTSLYEESNTITDAVYLGKWYEFDVRARKALVILMERAKIPISIKVGKILDMSVVTFAMILRRSYSLFAVLENYNIEST